MTNHAAMVPGTKRFDWHRDDEARIAYIASHALHFGLDEAMLRIDGLILAVHLPNFAKGDDWERATELAWANEGKQGDDG